MNRTAPILAIAGLALGLMACEEPVGVCTEEARSSVSLTLLDSEGAPIDGVVQYAVDGEAAEDCEQIGDVGEYVCGWEEPGDFVITASAEGHEEAQEELLIEMTEDECHVVTQVLEIQLQAAPAE